MPPPPPQAWSSEHFQEPRRTIFRVFARPCGSDWCCCRQAHGHSPDHEPRSAMRPVKTGWGAPFAWADLQENQKTKLNKNKTQQEHNFTQITAKNTCPPTPLSGSQVAV